MVSPELPSLGVLRASNADGAGKSSQQETLNPRTKHGSKIRRSVSSLWKIDETLSAKFEFIGEAVGAL